MKVYITNANLKMIFRSVKGFIKADRNLLIQSLLDEVGEFANNDNINEILNTNTLKDINIFKLILKNLDEFKLNKDHILTFIERENKIYQYKIKNPAYHINNNCEWMNKDFENIIKESGKKIVYKNSGIIQVENSSLENLILKGEQKLTQLKFYFDTEFAKKIKNYRYAPKITLELLKNEKKEVQNQVLEFHQVKQEFIQIIFEILKNKYNKDMAFDKSILEFIGFRCCKSCG